MSLRGVKPTKIEQRLKVLFYGAAGVGKTTAAINFPKPYLIDTEKGATHSQYVDLLDKNGGVVFQTYDFDELIKEVKALLTEKHEYKTLIIDPLTTIYNDLVDKAALKSGTEFGKHYVEANKRIKNLLSLLIRLPMNVIITSHSKNEYATGMTIIGSTFDCYKKLDYLFDLVFEINKRGKERIGIVKKTRIEAFPDGEIFPFHYEEIARRYGKEILEKEATPEILATNEQVLEINRLIELLKVPEETFQKWLDKSQSHSFEEMPQDVILKCINHLKEKINGE